MPKIKDIFDIDNAVAEHGNKIFLLGGVGSGKSTWVSDILTKKGAFFLLHQERPKYVKTFSILASPISFIGIQTGIKRS